ncbi:MAG: phage tail protein [Promicromonosporaceae bacterium]|nr:phage tail protein [Promicromonosporaceae bacterium]
MPLPDLDASAAHSFTVTIDGIQIPAVIEVTGIKSEVEKIEYKEQTSSGKYIVRNLIGRAKPGEFTVTRGLTDSKTISDWIKTVMNGDIAGSRKTASIVYADYEGSPIKTYNFVNCWVTNIEVSGMKAGATEPATEKFTVVYDEMTVS